MTEHRSYYAIIPANVRYDKRLKPNTKLLYGEITALCNERGFCWAGNEYFADLYGVNKETISRWVSDLIKFGYLNREIIYKEGTNQIINRYLRINQYPIDEKRNTPIDEKVKDNNTSINNTFNNTKEYIRELPPSKKSKAKPVRHKYGEYKNVLLSDEQMEKLKTEFPNDYKSESNDCQSIVNHLVRLIKTIWQLFEVGQGKKKVNLRTQAVDTSAQEDERSFLNGQSTKKPISRKKR